MVKFKVLSNPPNPLPGLSTSHVFKYGEHHFPGKARYDASRQRQIHVFSEMGGIGHTLNSTINNFRFSSHTVEYTANSKLQTSSNIREITGIHLEITRYGSKSGDYKHKSGDREIRFKIWRLPDYPRELTALHYKYLGVAQALKKKTVIS